MSDLRLTPILNKILITVCNRSSESLSACDLLKESSPDPRRRKDPHSTHSTVMCIQSTRSRVIELYKNLHYLGREYPKGSDYFHAKLKNAFMKNKDETDPEKIEQLIARGNFVIKELEALYMLRKYRTLKQRYEEEPPVK